MLATPRQHRAILRGAAVTVALVCTFFAETIFGGGVYYPGDIARIYLPQRTALSRAMAAGSLPWWSADIGAGYPLLAEGETGALYPLNWLLYGLLSPELGVNVSIILHYLLAGSGFYVCARKKSSPGAAFLGSIVFTFGGFSIAHLSHLSILSVAAWLPWMFVLTQNLLDSEGQKGKRHWLSALGLAIVVGLQFLAGHAQVSLLGLICLAAYALFMACRSHTSGRISRRFGLWLGAMFLGVLLGAPQLLSTLELGSLSQRAGGLDSTFFTSYSFHPFLVATYLSPFVLGNPYPEGSVELMGYVGLLPLALALVALWPGRHSCPRREKWFYAALALTGVLLAFGRWNPLYIYLQRVPLLNLFRVPARYLYWTSFGLAMLAAFGLDTLRASSGERTTTIAGWVLVGLVGLLLLAALVGIWCSPDVEGLISFWRWLPLVFIVIVLAILLATKQVRARVCVGVACMAMCVDLYAYGAVLDGTYNAVMPRQLVIRQPESLRFLTQDDSLYRLYTKKDIVPALSVMRESYYPNLAMTHDLSSANIYLPLVPVAYGSYLDDLTPERLNRLNVKYYLIPQLLPVDAESELYDVHNPFSSLPANEWLNVSPITVASLDIESYLSHSAGLGDGELAAELLLRDEAGREVSVPLRVGVETAEWAYERDDVRTNIAHSMSQVATTWPAQSGFPPRQHVGHTYLAHITLHTPQRLTAVMLRPTMPQAFVRVERVRLYDASGQVSSLAHLVGLGEHSIVYRSEDVVIYRNEDVLPRAYTLAATAVGTSGASLTMPEVLRPADIGPVIVIGYEDMIVTLRASVEEPSYLILADLFYPGWEATVDGAQATILRADDIFRALSLTPGEHRITFAYKPRVRLY